MSRNGGGWEIEVGGVETWAERRWERGGGAERWWTGGKFGEEVGGKVGMFKPCLDLSKHI